MVWAKFAFKTIPPSPLPHCCLFHRRPLPSTAAAAHNAVGLLCRAIHLGVRRSEVPTEQDFVRRGDVEYSSRKVADLRAVVLPPVCC